MTVKELKDFLNDCEDDNNVFVVIRSERKHIELYEHGCIGNMIADSNFEIDIPNDNTIWLTIKV